jgi:hypothetical protein
MGLLMLRYVILVLIIGLCFVIGVLQRFPPLEGLLTIIILILLGLFFQNERELNFLKGILKKLQT